MHSDSEELEHKHADIDTPSHNTITNTNRRNDNNYIIITSANDTNRNTHNSLSDRGSSNSSNNNSINDDPSIPPSPSPATAPPPSSSSSSPSSSSPSPLYRLGLSTSLRWLSPRLQPMLDSTPLLSLPPPHASIQLRAALGRDGYVRLKGFLEREKVREARKVVLKSLWKDWGMVEMREEREEERDGGNETNVDSSSNSSDVANSSNNSASRPSSTPLDSLLDRALIPPSSTRGILLTGFRSVTHHPSVLSLLESPPLYRLFSSLLFAGRAAATFDNKWVRVHGRGERTDEHTDYYRFEGNAKEMYTCWIPLGKYGIEGGTLAVAEGTHRMKGYENGRNAEMERKEELPPDWTEVGEGEGGGVPLCDRVVWRTCDFDMGDVVIFDIRLIHASTVNQTNTYRLSMDTRWQPVECVPHTQQQAFNRQGTTVTSQTSASSTGLIHSTSSAFQIH